MAVAGLGFGLYMAVDLALVADVLPDPDSAAKDLGVLNIAGALPFSIGPALAPLVLAIGSGSYQVLYAVAGVCALIGAAAILPVQEGPVIRGLLDLCSHHEPQAHGERDDEPHQAGGREMGPLLGRQRTVEQRTRGEVEVHPGLELAEPVLLGGQDQGQGRQQELVEEVRHEGRRPSCGRARRA